MSNWKDSIKKGSEMQQLKYSERLHNKMHTVINSIHDIIAELEKDSDFDREQPLNSAEKLLDLALELKEQFR